MQRPQRESDPSHIVARLCRSTPSAAIALLSTASGIATWNLGLWNTRDIASTPSGGESIVGGESLFDGKTGYAAVTVQLAQGIVEYRVGTDPQSLAAPRIHARVRAGESLGYDAGVCLVALIAWRPADMSDDRWSRLCTTHETEIELIRARLEGS